MLFLFFCILWRIFRHLKMQGQYRIGVIASRNPSAASTWSHRRQMVVPEMLNTFLSCQYDTGETDIEFLFANSYSSDFLNIMSCLTKNQWKQFRNKIDRLRIKKSLDFTCCLTVTFEKVMTPFCCNSFYLKFTFRFRFRFQLTQDIFCREKMTTLFSIIYLLMLSNF